MGKYRKKPVVIEAVQLRRDTWSEICEFAGVGRLSDGKPQGKYVDAQGYATDSYTEVMGLALPTLEGLMVAREGDWIIKGVKGELYPCKPDVFEATYERMMLKLFRVIDPQTGKRPDGEKIALTEEWAKDLLYCDIVGFLVDEEGWLYIYDDTYELAACPPGRFEIVWQGGAEHDQANS